MQSWTKFSSLWEFWSRCVEKFTKSALWERRCRFIKFPDASSKLTIKCSCLNLGSAQEGSVVERDVLIKSPSTPDNDVKLIHVHGPNLSVVACRDGASHCSRSCLESSPCFREDNDTSWLLSCSSNGRSGSSWCSLGWSRERPTRTCFHIAALQREEAHLTMEGQTHRSSGSLWDQAPGSPGGTKIRRKFKREIRCQTLSCPSGPGSCLLPQALGLGDVPPSYSLLPGDFPQNNLKQVHPADRYVNPKLKLELDSLFPLPVLFNLVEFSFSFHVLPSVVSVSYERWQQHLLRDVEGTRAVHITSSFAHSFIVISCDCDLDVYDDPTSPFAQTCPLFEPYRCIQLLRILLSLKHFSIDINSELYFKRLKEQQ